MSTHRGLRRAQRLSTARWVSAHVFSYSPGLHNLALTKITKMLYFLLQRNRAKHYD
jgi:hypothetical protein